VRAEVFVALVALDAVSVVIRAAAKRVSGRPRRIFKISISGGRIATEISTGHDGRTMVRCAMLSHRQ